MDDAERLARINQLREALLASDERRLVVDFRRVANTYGVFLGNESELRLLLARTSEMDVALELWTIQNRPAFEAFLGEVDRLLHNYLAAVGSLRDQTRRLWNKYLPDDEAYAERVGATFAESGFCLFVQNLRNYTLHSNLPITQGHLSWERGRNVTSAVRLSRPDLLKWPRWPPLARRYLAELPEDGIDLAELVGAYTNTVTQFNNWFGETFVELCEDAFVRVREMQEELNELLPGSSPQSPEPFAGGAGGEPNA
jgi:hypothetical protein